ncbi:HsdR family type I site-specific deoxyribonuclease [Rudanella paleaurantiibacter]|uniref:Type I restriction enzyme endonuclease subunit n=1 Tax=Rudanella paleaurantiibacter TaxID=2614655 RepID=A0A7J5U3L2_9BACT|nr:HsdR family type I site-specific deoxyribonuclease [Rudanella paleaurantiibacter]
MNEDQLEQLCLKWFTEAGWTVEHGPDIAPDGPTPLRASYSDVLLRGLLQDALVRLNPHLPPSAIEQAIGTLAKPESLDLRQNNRTFHRLLLDGVPVEYRVGDDIKQDHALLADFRNPDRNDFRVVNQFSVQGRHNRVRRPDLVCFLNGLPIAFIELKNPTDENTDIWDAYNQVQTYKKDIPELFAYNEALVVSDGFKARMGSLTANQERFLPWRTIKDEDDKPLVEWQLDVLVRGFFAPVRLLEYLRYFILFENNEGQLIKKMAAYHQFHAVREAVQATILASEAPTHAGVQERRAPYGQLVEPGSRKAGVVWHTQGSGKSISMCCYAGMLLQQPEMKNPTLLIVTDRNDLDGQLFQTFSGAQELLKQTPVQADDREALRQLLAEREAGGILFTTIQKFSLLDGEEGHPILNDRYNLVVISDEAHRSQYGFGTRLDTKTGRYKVGYAKLLRDALPNATFIGFTGTPIEAGDRDTRTVFGDYVSIYDIQDAVDDGATVPIYYESRLAKIDINQADIEALSDKVEEVVEDEEDVEAREKTRSEWSQLEKLVGAAPRIGEVANDLVKHFEARLATMDGKGMIVCMSREICVHMYNALIALRPDWHDDDPEKGQLKIVMTGSAADTELLHPHIYSKAVKKRLEKRFKDPTDPLRLVIVRDMWLTGFDAPACHTMYIDKPMKGHNLMQAIARVNRVFRNKPGGLVVDYIGIATELKQALKLYTDAKGKGEPAHLADEALAKLLETVDVIRGQFATPVNGNPCDLRHLATNPLPLLAPAANHILALDNGKKRFLDQVLKATKAFALCGTLDEAEALRTELAFYSAIKAIISKHTTVDQKRTQAEKHSALKLILDNAIRAEGVDDIFALAGLEKPNIGLLSDEFLEDVRKTPYRNLAVELLEKLLQDNIRSKTRNNVVQERKYGERLQGALRRYNNRAIESAQVIEELIQMAKDFQAAIAREEALGLKPDEIAFYDALANDESAVRQMTDDTLKDLARELTEKLRASTTVDWQVRESVRARLRILVRRLLQKYKYPPEKSDAAVKLVLDQAEALSDRWSSIY